MSRANALRHTRQNPLSPPHPTSILSRPVMPVKHILVRIYSEKHTNQSLEQPKGCIDLLVLLYNIDSFTKAGVHEGKMSDRESGGGWEEGKMGTWDPSGDTYMKALHWWCVCQRSGGTRSKQERN